MLNDTKLEALVDTLHAQSASQNDAIAAYFQRRIEARTLSWDGLDADATTFFRDKLVALEEVKAEFCYAMCRALRAERVVECGTSTGVSTLYLAAAVRTTGAGASSPPSGSRRRSPPREEISRRPDCRPTSTCATEISAKR
jgi:predicted O-methyltransferase YrrM